MALGRPAREGVRALVPPPPQEGEARTVQRETPGPAHAPPPRAGGPGDRDQDATRQDDHWKCRRARDVVQSPPMPYRRSSSRTHPSGPEPQDRRGGEGAGGDSRGARGRERLSVSRFRVGLASFFLEKQRLESCAPKFHRGPSGPMGGGRGGHRAPTPPTPSTPLCVSEGGAGGRA